MSKRVILPALPTADEDLWPYAVIDSEGHIHCPSCAAVDSFSPASLSLGAPISPDLVVCLKCDYSSGTDYGIAQEQ